MSKHLAKKEARRRKRAERAAEAARSAHAPGTSGDKRTGSNGRSGEKHSAPAGTGRGRGQRPERAQKPEGARSAGRKHARSSAARGFCPLAEKCGGCSLAGMPYADQLARKQRAMEKLFAPIVACSGCAVDPIAPMERPFGYRHKAATPFAPGPQGAVRSGFFAAGTHRIVPCASCPVEAEGAREILNGVARTLEELGISAHNEDTHRGLARYAVLRLGWRTDEGILTLVTNGRDLPRRSELVERLVALDPRITCLAQNVNQRPGNAILGRETTVLAGKPVMRDQLLGCTFEISPTAFYQTNPEQTEVLYSLAIDAAGFCDGDVVLDAYCGSGTIGICAAAAAREAGGRLRLIGVERGKEAVRDARRNAQLNQLDDAAFIAEDATTYLTHAASDGQHVDVLLMDPPRAGSTQAFLRNAAALGPRRIVYVSCNPATQVRDLELLGRMGYRTVSVNPVDMFPHTDHVETVAALERA